MPNPFDTRSSTFAHVASSWRRATVGPRATQRPTLGQRGGARPPRSFRVLPGDLAQGRPAAKVAGYDSVCLLCPNFRKSLNSI
jgi:hypothetical protein